MAEKAVENLKDKLSKAKKNLDVADPALDSESDDMMKNLILMSNFLPKILTSEKQIVDQLSLLERVLDDDLSFKDKLICIERDVYKMTRLSSKTLTMSMKKPDSRSKEDAAHTAVASNERTNLIEEDKIFNSNVMSTLCNTFNCLESPYSKICSLCLSVFPENAAIKRRPLIYWWIGEGVVAKKHETTAEEVGEQVFQELLDEGFIKRFKPNNSNSNFIKRFNNNSSSSSSTSSFIVHPWIRLMLIALAQKSGFLNFTSNGTPCDDRRRAFSWRRNEVGDNMNEEGVMLTTVFNMKEQYLGQSDRVRRLGKVEVLQMGRWQESTAHHIEVADYNGLFDDLGSRKHLRYLSLRGISRIESLPRSVTKLVSLQILDLRACHNLEKLPNGIAQLKNLTHLDVSECYLLETMPKGLEHLSNLQVMKGFVVGSRGRNACRLTDLVGLKKLRKLSLRVLDDKPMDLSEFKQLRILTISWVVGRGTDVKLPTELVKLHLLCVPFEKVPQWMEASKLPNLKKLYITGGMLKEFKHDDYSNCVSVRLTYLKALTT